MDFSIFKPAVSGAKELFSIEKKNVQEALTKLKEFDFANADYGKMLHDFIYGKPHEERRLGDLYEDRTCLYKHREWRGIKDTFYYFNNIWLYNYAMAVKDIVTSDDPIAVLKGFWRYRWLGQGYMSVLHWFDRGLEGERGLGLRASAWHYRAMVCETVRQFCRLCAADSKLHNGQRNELWYKTFAHDETVSGAIFYPWRDRADDVPLQMVPYFVTVHVNCNAVLSYIDAIQSIGLPGDPCPMCQAESGIFVLDDYPDYSPFMVTSNEACDASVSTSITTDWFFNRPLFAMPQPMQFDDPLVQKYCQKEIENCWKFIEEQTGMPFNRDEFIKHIKAANEITEFEHEKWEVSGKTDYYPINGVAQALYRIYSSQVGDRPEWHEIDAHVRKIMTKAVQNKINPYPKARHRVLAWSCAPMFYSYWCTWAYNCWGLKTVINMDSLMFDIVIRTDTDEHMMEDFTKFNEWAPMRRMAVGGYKHIFECWENMERFNCDMIMMYDQIQCKGMTGIHGMFEDEFRNRGIPACWMPHALDDRRPVTRAEIRNAINEYMSTVMKEEPLDPTLLEFDDEASW